MTTEEERDNCNPPDIIYAVQKIEGCKTHKHLKDIDGNALHYCYFWGPSAKTAGLLEFLTPPPPTRYEDAYEWGSECERQLDDDERVICCYAMLATIHDIQVSEKPIFTAKMYSGTWGLRYYCNVLGKCTPPHKIAVTAN